MLAGIVMASVDSCFILKGLASCDYLSLITLPVFPFWIAPLVSIVPKTSLPCAFRSVFSPSVCFVGVTVHCVFVRHSVLCFSLVFLDLPQPVLSLLLPAFDFFGLQLVFFLKLHYVIWGKTV